MRGIPFEGPTESGSDHGDRGGDLEPTSSRASLAPGVASAWSGDTGAKGGQSAPCGFACGRSRSRCWRSSSPDAGPAPEHYVAVLDELSVPADWELVCLTVNAPGGPDVSADPGVPRKLTDCAIGDCPAVGRYYLVDGPPVDTYPVAKQLLLDAGFDLDRDSGADCDLPPSSAACVLGGHKEGDRVQVCIFNPGDDFANLGVADPKRALVSVVAERDKESR